MNKFSKYLLVLTSGLTATVVGVRGDLAVTVTPSVVSQYMFRGVRVGGAAFQPSIELAEGNLRSGLWVSTFLSDKISGSSDPEIDPYASYTFTVNDKFNLTPGFSYYTYPDADESAGLYKSTFEPYVSASYTIKSVTITPKVYYDTVLKGPTFELGAEFSVPISLKKTSLDFAFIIGTYSWKETTKGATPPVKNHGDYFQAGVTLPFQLSANRQLAFGLMYTGGFNNRYESAGTPNLDNTAAVGRVVASVSCACSF